MEPWWGFNPRTHAGCDYAPHAIPTLMSGFNPRTHAGCDACAAAAAAPTPRFNPRTHAGCDQTDCVVRATPCFNPRTHAGCDPNAASFPPTRCSHVSIHAPTQGATIPQHPRWPCRPPFQSTHPRRVRRRAADRAIDRAGVSIHAPTQGATMGTVRLAAVGVVSIHAPTQVRRAGVAWYGHTQRVSIHAPTQGATPASPGWPNRSKMFQSTHPRRVRLHLRARIDGFAGVSIHAPTQVRPANTMTAGKTREFQSTHPRRVRRELPGPLPVQHGVSIHAPTQGATKSPTCRPRWRSCFNPRTHAGCDVHLVTKLRQASEVSIHAPTQGATPNAARAPDREFQSTHPRVRPQTQLGRVQEGVSIHAPTQGATGGTLAVFGTGLFQSTHPRRVRRGAIYATSAPSLCFNPRTHAGCDRRPRPMM